MKSTINNIVNVQALDPANLPIDAVKESTRSRIAFVLHGQVSAPRGFWGERCEG